MIENTDVKVSYEAEGKTYVIPFSYESPDDVEVIFTDEAGVDAKLAASAYEVQEDNVVLLEEPQAGTITLIRVQSPTQSLSLTANDRFPAAAVEAGMDRTVRSVQQNAEAVARSVKTAPADTVEDAEITLPKKDKRSDAILGWDANGKMAAVGKASDLAGVYSAKEMAEAARDEALEAKSAAEEAKSAAELSASDAQISASDAQTSASQAVDAENATFDYRNEAQAALQQVLSVANNLHYCGTWDPSSGNPPSDSPQTGQFWVMSEVGTFANMQWAAGDAALFDGTDWNKLPLDTLLAEEASARRKADLSRWPWVDLNGAVAYIPSLKSLSAPLTICLCYDLAEPIPTDVPNWSIFSASNYLNDNGIKYYGVAVSFTKLSSFGIASMRIAVGDGGTEDSTSHGLSIAYWNAENLPTGKHTLAIVLYNEWNGTAGTVKAQAFVDGKIFKNNIGGDYGQAWGSSAQSFDFSYKGDKRTTPASWHSDGFYDTKTPATTPMKLARCLLLGVALPATKADDLAGDAPIGYSVEQYDAGEEPPQSLLADDCYVCYSGQLQGVQWRDAGSARAHAVAEGAVVKADMPALNTDTLTWAGTADAKGILSATTNTLPANTRVALRLKASAACTVAIGDGAATSPTTYVAPQTLEANKWTDVPAIYTTADGKLTVKPSAAFTGTINAQLILETLN